MSKYQDRYSMWHDRECINGEPSSNNSYIYSAYSKYLAPKSIINSLVKERFNKCVRSYSPLLVDRKPGIKYPPQSKDEIIGMVSLGYLNNRELENNHYNFCNISRDFDRKLTLKSFIKAARSLWKISKEHRNYFWQNEMTEVYPLAFKLMPWDVYYVRKMAGKKAGIFNTIMFYLNFLAVMLGDDKSTKMMLWLQCEDLGKKLLLKFINKKDIVKEYFGEEHDLYQRNW